jgi:NADH-quinone oxidoreductase subunit G
MAELVNLMIDGHEVSVPRGTTILEAAKTIGSEVPHYCYHPGMSSPAMCRLCLVEVEGAPKPMPGCVTTVNDGQVVHTQSEQARSNRQGVLEFYLVNHPLDCPICDMSGECNLQDYVHAEGREHGRGREPKRIFGRDDFGGDILFYGDRCVMCTRCVRFMSEVEQDHRLTVVERGNRSVIDTFFDEGLDGTHWHGNIVDICPVGALVSKEFLHKARAWDLKHTPSICTSCSQGCNIDLHTRDNLIQRIKPRENLDVNAWWICDYGRHDYEWINQGHRLEAPLVRDDSTSKASGWKDALSGLLAKAAGLDNSSVKAVASPFSSNEDLAALCSAVDALGGGEIVYRSAVAEDEVPLKGFPGLARRKDLSPNTTAANLMEMARVGSDDATGGLDSISSHDGIIVVLGDALADQTEAFGAKAGLYVYLGTHDAAAATRADFVLPVTTHAESDGTFTNHEGRVQRFTGALEAPGMSRPAWLILGALASERSGAAVARTAEEAFSAVGARAHAFSGMSYDDIGSRGAVVNETVSLTGD